MRGGILIGGIRPGDRDDRVRLLAARHQARQADAVVAHGWACSTSYRSAGVGYQLKLLQRERTLAMGLDLIEWTYDPMQAMNAHLNFAKLGVVVEEYEVNVYGDRAARCTAAIRPTGSSPNGGFAMPHVERRACAGGGAAGGCGRSTGASRPRRRAVPAGEWLECARRRSVARRAPHQRRDPDGLHRDAVARRRISRWPGAWRRARSSRPISRAAIARWSSSSTARRRRARICWSGRPEARVYPLSVKVRPHRTRAARSSSMTQATSH